MDQSKDANPENGHSDDYQKLVDRGINESTAAELDKIYQSGRLTHTDLDERALNALKELSIDDGVAVVQEYSEADIPSMPNKSAYMCSVIKIVRQRKARGDGGNFKEPNEAKIKAVLERTGYAFEVTSGQRKYGGPPPGMEETPPGSGHELFCGKLPRDIYEDELVPLFEEHGQIWDLRIMMDPIQSCGRGYCFVTYTDKAAADIAAKKLDGHEIRPGKHLKVNASVANVRLFVGNVPKTRSKEEIQKEFDKIVHGLTEVIVYYNTDDKLRNRGFAFLNFDCHKNAAQARKKLMSGHHRLFNSEIIVDWADPQEEPDEQTMSTVKVLYVRNLSSDVTEAQLTELFKEYGTTDRVKKVKDYAFIHFQTREHALAAMECLNGTKIGKLEAEISLAKPMIDNKKKEMRRREQEKRNFYMMGRYSGYDDMWYQPMWRGPPHRGMRGGGGGGGRFPPPPPRGHYEGFMIDDELYEDEFDDYHRPYGPMAFPDFPPEFPPEFIPDFPGPPPLMRRGRGRGREPPFMERGMPFRGGSSDRRGMRGGMVPLMGRSRGGMPGMGPGMGPGMPPPMGGRGRGPMGGRGGFPRGGRGDGRGDFHERGDFRGRGMGMRARGGRGPGRGQIATRVASARTNRPRNQLISGAGMKRKADQASTLIDVKQARVGESKPIAEPQEKTWHIQPIAQQPLTKAKPTRQGAGTEQWYEDSFGAGW